MKFEVEQKFRVDGHASLAAALGAMGAEPAALLEQSDAYLSHPSRDFAATNEALRLRSVGERNLITYKGPKRPGPTKTREELEIAYEDGPERLAAMKRLFEALGFRPVCTIRKRRSAYELSYGGLAIEVALDEVEGLGAFAEIEAIADGDADLPAAQAAVQALARQLGLTQLEPRSYLRMTLEEAGGAPSSKSAGQT
jgi:adenylate cyclase class 2